VPRKLALAALVLWSTACQQVLGIEELPAGVAPVDAAPSACAVPGASATCGACMETSCCAEVTACRSEENCRRSLEGILKCDPNDAACAAKSVVKFDAKLADALACRARSCADPCATVCGGILGVMRPLTAAKPACAPCHAAKACSEIAACAADSKCLQWAACQYYCPLLDRACRSQCQHPLGRHELADAAFSKMKQCQTDCAEGSEWSCVDRSTYAVGARTAEVPFHVIVNDSLSTDVVFPGVTLTPCLDAQCTERVGTPCTSDATGHCAGTLRITSPGPLFNGYLRAEGKDIFPTLYFIHPRLTGAIAGDAMYAPQNVGGVPQTRVDVGFSVVPGGRIAGRGHVLAIFTDCVWAAGSGLTISVSSADERTQTLYLRGSLPGGEATDGSGIAFAFNLPPSDLPVTVTGKLGERVVAEMQVFVQPDLLSYVLLGPR